MKLMTSTPRVTRSLNSRAFADGAAPLPTLAQGAAASSRTSSPDKTTLTSRDPSALPLAAHPHEAGETFNAPPPRPPCPLHPPPSAGARHPITNPPPHASQHSSSWSDDGHERHAIENPLRPGKKGCPRPEKELFAFRRNAPAPGGENFSSWF